MKKFVFATNNAHKLQEVEAIVGEKIEILSLKDIGCQADIPETADTLEGNALQKARFIYETYHQDCFADDTGLEVEALNGAPGVYSARYAGDAHNSEANMRKLLQDLEGVENRLYTNFCRDGRCAEEQNQPPGRGSTEVVQVPKHAVDNNPSTNKKGRRFFPVLFLLHGRGNEQPSL